MLEDTMTSLTAHCPYLESLRLDMPFGVFDPVLLSYTLRRCGMLKHLSLAICDLDSKGFECGYAVNFELLSVIAALPKLSELHILSGPLYERDAVRSIAFPSLRVLSLRGQDTSSLSGILEDCTFPSVVELSISFFFVSGQPSDVTELPRIIRSHVSCDTITSLIVQNRGWRVKMPYRPIVFSAPSFRPLLDFRNLEHLEFRPRLGISLTDVDLEGFARSWPRLHTLRIVGDHDIETEDLENSVARPTYRGLAHLVRLCPDLTDISIVIAEPEGGVPTLLEDLPVSPHRVRLELKHFVFLDVRFAALWISKMFPYLRLSGRSVIVTAVDLEEILQKQQKRQRQRRT